MDFNHTERTWESSHADDSNRARSVQSNGIAPHAELDFGGIIQLMNIDATELLKRALSLSVAERAELAGSLIESLDRANDESVKTAWEEEIVRRMNDLDSGSVKPVSLEEARQRLSSAIE